MKLSLFLIILNVLPLLPFKTQAQKREKFSASEVKADFDYLYQTLQASHYNLFVNTPKSRFEQEFKRINASIKDSLTSLQINRLFQPFAAMSKLGHCNTGYPFSSYNAYMARGGKVFPFDVRITQGRVSITGNYSKDTTVGKGDEILAFYGVKAKDWLNKLYTYLSGENEEYKNTLVDMIGFPRLHWMVYDEAKIYSLKIKKQNGQIVYVNDEGMPASEYKKILSNKAPIFNDNRDFKFIKDVAYLRPGVFLNKNSGGDISTHQAFEKGEFLHFIDSVFVLIHKNRAQHLVIDLRGNPGGDNSFSDPMVSYFASKPFSFSSAFYVKTSKLTKEFWKEATDSSVVELRNNILTKKDGEIFNHTINKYPPRTDSLTFKGKIYVLIDRYTYSNAVTTAALIQDYKFGKLIGEQTADSPTLYAAVHEYKLPHTQISVTYPKAFIIRPNGDKALKGVEPDFQIQQDTRTEADEVLEWTLDYIDKSGK